MVTVTPSTVIEDTFGDRVNTASTLSLSHLHCGNARALPMRNSTKQQGLQGISLTPQLHTRGQTAVTSIEFVANAAMKFSYASDLPFRRCLVLHGSDVTALATPEFDDIDTYAGPYTQVPTPPQSQDGSLSEPDESIGDNPPVSVSTTFFPGAQTHTFPPDVTLLSSDSVFFYTHSHILLTASDNGFQSLLLSRMAGDPWTVHVPETSAVLNVILHAIYDMSCAQYSPSYEVLATAVERLPLYGISPASRILPTTHLYTLLLSHAPLRPLELYALAASFALDALAVATSSHLLGLHLSSITDELALRMGPIYLKRLFFLHFGRSEALKLLLLAPPHPHPPTPTCDFTKQKSLTRAWALASAYFAWDARPDTSTSALETALQPLQEQLTCEVCRATLKERIKGVVVQWSIVKRTI
ncbi:BTB domain-containing protein [Pleurotus pulmonarius]